LVGPTPAKRRILLRLTLLLRSLAFAFGWTRPGRWRTAIAELKVTRLAALIFAIGRGIIVASSLLMIVIAND
jgi:hypothetical protein